MDKAQMILIGTIIKLMKDANTNEIEFSLDELQDIILESYRGGISIATSKKRVIVSYISPNDNNEDHDAVISEHQLN